MTLRHLIAVLVTLGLAALATWLLPYGRERRHLFYKDYAFNAAEIERLARHPEILYAYGREAEGRFDSDSAADFYGRLVAHDPLYLDAWLRLAELSARSGKVEQARRITAFCSRMTSQVVRWKWPIILLAHELELEETFDAGINFLLARHLKTDDALFLLETRTQSDPERALAHLTPANRPAYLQWAMRWQRPAAAQAVWKTMSSAGTVEETLLNDYVHFLVSSKKVRDAAEVWQRHGANAGMANAGFEAEPTGRGFDWRIEPDRSGYWKVERAARQGRGGNTALQLRFAGRENVSFHHLRQIVSVTPQTQYRLQYWWKSQGLTTDQTPFVEIQGYDEQQINARSAAIPAGTYDWQKAEVVFTAPAECHAVVVVLRRLPSRRFDNRIEGTLWLDDFELSNPFTTAAGHPTATDPSLEHQPGEFHANQ